MYRLGSLIKKSLLSLIQPNYKAPDKPNATGYSKNGYSFRQHLRYLIVFIQNAAKYLCVSECSLSQKLAKSSPPAAVKFSIVSAQFVTYFQIPYWDFLAQGVHPLHFITLHLCPIYFFPNVLLCLLCFSHWYFSTCEGNTISYNLFTPFFSYIFVL